MYYYCSKWCLYSRKHFAAHFKGKNLQTLLVFGDFDCPFSNFKMSVPNIDIAPAYVLYTLINFERQDRQIYQMKSQGSNKDLPVKVRLAIQIQAVIFHVL